MVTFVAATNRTPDPDTALVAFPWPWRDLLLPFFAFLRSPAERVHLHGLYLYLHVDRLLLCQGLLALRGRPLCHVGHRVPHVPAPSCSCSALCSATGAPSFPTASLLVRTGVMVAVCVYVLLARDRGVSAPESSRRAVEPQVVVRKVVQSFEEADDAPYERHHLPLRSHGPRARRLRLAAQGRHGQASASELGICGCAVPGCVQGLYSKTRREQEGAGRGAVLLYGFEEEGDRPMHGRRAAHTGPGSPLER